MGRRRWQHPYEKNQKKKKQKTQVPVDIDETDCSSDNLTIHDESDEENLNFLVQDDEELMPDFDHLDNMFPDCLENISPELEIEGNTFSIGSFILVKFVYGKETKKPTEKVFIGQVVEPQNNGQINVKFLRKSSKVADMFVFPLVDDIQEVTLDQIIKQIEPQNISRGRHLFPNTKTYNCS